MSILGRIGELRKRHEKLSINKLEQECGLTRGSMAKWDDHAPSPDKVKKVADYFNVSVEYLLYGDPSAGIKLHAALHACTTMNENGVQRSAASVKILVHGTRSAFFAATSARIKLVLLSC